jgi:hypothetical protein
LPFSFKDNRPGKKWVHAFLKRNKEHMVIRKPTNIRRCRAAVSPAQIRAYFAIWRRKFREFLRRIYSIATRAACEMTPQQNQPSSKRESAIPNRKMSI